MSQSSEMAFMQALNMGLLKSNDAKILKFIETVGPHTWPEIQTSFERILGKRMKDSSFSSSVSRLNKDGKLTIISQKLNPQSGCMNSVYDVVR